MNEAMSIIVIQRFSFPLYTRGSRMNYEVSATSILIIIVLHITKLVGLQYLSGSVPSYTWAISVYRFLIKTPLRLFVDWLVRSSWSLDHARH